MNMLLTYHHNVVNMSITLFTSQSAVNPKTYYPSIESSEYPMDVHHYLIEDVWHGFEATPAKRPKHEHEEEDDEDDNALEITLKDEGDADVLQKKTLQVLQVATSISFVCRI